MGRTEKLPNVLDVQVASSLLKQSRKRIHLQRITSPVDLRDNHVLMRVLLKRISCREAMLDIRTIVRDS